LGGVIINLDIGRTIQQMADLAHLTADEMVKQYWQHETFHQYEKGQITDEEFKAFLRGHFRIEASDEALHAAWNAMILDIPTERLNLLNKLKEDYQLFLLSNTNNIHLQRVNEVFVPLNGEVLDDYFYQAYYSHQMGMRKPDREIYDKVIEDHQLNPETTLFLDDNKGNLEGAKSVGLQTYWVENPNQLKALFNAEKI